MTNRSYKRQRHWGYKSESHRPLNLLCSLALVPLYIDSYLQLKGLILHRFPQHSPQRRSFHLVQEYKKNQNSHLL